MIHTLKPAKLSQSHHDTFDASLKTILQRLPATLIVGLVLFLFATPALFPALFVGYWLLMHLILLASNFRALYAINHIYRNAITSSKTNYRRKAICETGDEHDLPFDDIMHVILLPNYKEDLPTLHETLSVLASHSFAKTQYRVCLAMEESEPDCVQKANTLVDQYREDFYDIRFTVHPSGRDGEIRGKSSNVAWAAQQMAKIGNIHSNQIMTVMDADTCFAQDYFAACAYHYSTASPEQRSIMMFAPTTVFDR